MPLAGTCVVGRNVDGLRKVLAYLVLVHIEGSYEVDVTYVIAAQVDMHQTGHELVFLGLLVVVHTLH